MNLIKLIVFIFFIIGFLFFSFRLFKFISILKVFKNNKIKYDNFIVRTFFMLKHFLFRPVINSNSYSKMLVFSMYIFGCVLVIFRSIELSIQSMFPLFSFKVSSSEISLFFYNIYYSYVSFFAIVLLIVICISLFVRWINVKNLYFKKSFSFIYYFAIFINIISILLISFLSNKYLNVYLILNSFSFSILLISLTNAYYLHIVLAPINLLLAKMNFVKEIEENKGIHSLTDFTSKDVLDFYSCNLCGKCEDVCPSANVNKELSPKILMSEFKDIMKKECGQIVKTKTSKLDLSKEYVTKESVLWSCTTCGACEDNCFVFVKHLDKIVNLRKTNESVCKNLKTVTSNILQYSTPQGKESNSELQNIIKKFDLKTIDQDENSDFTLWIGCMGLLDNRYKNVVDSFISVLKKLNIRFTIFDKESCCGELLKIAGREEDANALFRSNSYYFMKNKVKKIITLCPHCFTVFKNEYKEFFNNKIVVESYVEYLNKMLLDGKMKLNKSFEGLSVYHDPCRLSRFNGISDAPRNILKSIPYTKLATKSYNKEENNCCGAGGGLYWMNNENEFKHKKISRERYLNLVKSRPDFIITSCPYCINVMEKEINDDGMSEKMKVFDVAEIVNKTI